MTPTIERFVLHWGEMGTRWGMNRSVAQIHALLYLSTEPITAEEIADTLSMARSNVSNSLKELLSWNLIELIHVLGDRRDHYTAITDMWDMAITIIEERKKRELEPTMGMLHQSMADVAGDDSVDPVVALRIKEMMDFMDALLKWYDQVSRLPRSSIRSLLKMGGKISRLLDKKT